MKKLFLAAVLFLSCASTQPVVNPPVTPPPKQDTVYVPVKVYDTVRVVKHDTVFTVRTDTLTILKYQPVVTYLPDTLYQVIPYDTVVNALHLAPVAGDNYPQMQAAINYCIANGIGDIDHSTGLFRISHTLIIADTSGQRFHNVTLRIHGAGWAKNSTSGYNTVISPTFTNAPAIIAQQCKGCVFENLEGWGQYSFPNTLTQLQIDTLTFNGWKDGKCTDGPTDAATFLSFDVFGDSSLFTGNYRMYAGMHPWYLPTGSSGSTACKVRGNYIHNFIGGVFVGCGPNLNCEEIDVDDNQFDYDLSAYGFGEAQAKNNTFNNNMIWGQVRHILDGVHFGFPHGDAATAPFVTGMNIAGFVYDYIECDTRAFSSNNRDVYGEGLFMLGITGSANSRGAGAAFTNCQIDLQNYAPSPPFLYQGAGTLFTGCDFRFYNGGTGPRRFVINDLGDLFIGGMMSAPPVVVQGQANYAMTSLLDVGMYYDYTLGSTLSRNNYDSIAGGLVAYLTVDRATFTGFYLTPDTGGLTPYMLLLTAALEPTDSASNYHPISQILNSQTIVGVYDHKNGDTVFLQAVGANFHTGDEVPIFKTLYKKQ